MLLITLPTIHGTPRRRGKGNLRLGAAIATLNLRPHTLITHNRFTSLNLERLWEVVVKGLPTMVPEPILRLIHGIK